jgi:hypothetical protein
MTRLEIPDREARRLLRLLDSQGRAERFPISVKQLQRALHTAAPSGLVRDSAQVENFEGCEEERTNWADAPRITADEARMTAGQDRPARSEGRERTTVHPDDGVTV